MVLSSLVDLCGRIRERGRDLGMSIKDLAERAGVSYGYMVQASRGSRTMGPKVRARVESALQAPAEIGPATTPSVDRDAVFERLNARGISQNEAARGHQLQPSLADREPPALSLAGGLNDPRLRHDALAGGAAEGRSLQTFDTH